MVTDAILDWLVALLSGLANLLPDFQMPTGTSLSILAAANFVLPIAEIPVIFSVMASFALASGLYFLWNWTIKKLRGAG
jgi:hypothetical protein